MNKVSFYHLSLSVSDIELVADWYTRLIGFQRVTTRLKFTADTSFIFLALKEMRLELVADQRSQNRPRPDPPSHAMVQGVSHFSFKVDSLDDTIELMKKNAVKIVIEDLIINEIRNRVMMVRDPDGNLVEFVEEI